MEGHTDTGEQPPERWDPGGTEWLTDLPPLRFEVIIFMREWTERHIRELIKNELKKSGGGGGGSGEWVNASIHTPPGFVLKGNVDFYQLYKARGQLFTNPDAWEYTVHETAELNLEWGGVGTSDFAINQLVHLDPDGIYRSSGNQVALVLYDATASGLTSPPQVPLTGQYDIGISVGGEEGFYGSVEFNLGVGTRIFGTTGSELSPAGLGVMWIGKQTATISLIVRGPALDDLEVKSGSINLYG